MFADDTSIYRCSKDVPLPNREINEDLDKLDEWLMGNKLSLNVAKTHSIRGGSREKSDQGSAKISWVWLYGCGNKYGVV